MGLLEHIKELLFDSKSQNLANTEKKCAPTDFYGDGQAI